MSPISRTTHNIGQITELFARQYLQDQGLSFIAANVRYKFGEIDLIMREQSTITFVEVKYRNRNDYGGALYSLHSAKQRRLQKAANAWLQSHDPSGRHPTRFDLVALSGSLQRLQCQWLKNIMQ